MPASTLMPNLCAYLLAIAPLVALTGNRIYRGQMPSGSALPYVVIEREGGPIHHLSGTSLVRIDTLTITAYATSQSGADAVAAELYDALDNYRGTLSTTGYVSILLQEDPERVEFPVDGSQQSLWAIEQRYQVEYPTTSPNPTEA
jgi:hypothetical protein